MSNGGLDPVLLGGISGNSSDPTMRSRSDRNRAADWPVPLMMPCLAGSTNPVKRFPLLVTAGAGPLRRPDSPPNNQILKNSQVGTKHNEAGPTRMHGYSFNSPTCYGARAEGLQPVARSAYLYELFDI